MYLRGFKDDLIWSKVIHGVLGWITQWNGFTDLKCMHQRAGVWLHYSFYGTGKYASKCERHEFQRQEDLKNGNCQKNRMIHWVEANFLLIYICLSPKFLLRSCWFLIPRCLPWYRGLAKQLFSFKSHYTGLILNFIIECMESALAVCSDVMWNDF